MKSEKDTSHQMLGIFKTARCVVGPQFLLQELQTRISTMEICCENKSCPQFVQKSPILNIGLGFKYASGQGT